MPFIDSLSDYLRGLTNTSEPNALSLSIEPAVARTHLIRSLERLEELRRTNAVPPATPPRRARLSLSSQTSVSELLTRWQRADGVVRFANRVAELLRQSFGKDATKEEVDDWVEVAIARQIGLPDALRSQIKTLELDRLSRIAVSEIIDPQLDPEATDVALYSAAIRSSRGIGVSTTITPIGRVFLELSGRDAIRWLLHLEVAQSTGPSDPLRISRETVAALVHQPTMAMAWGVDTPNDWTALERLEAFGLIRLDDDDPSERTVIQTLPLGLTLLRDVEREVETPMLILVNSLLADLTLSAAEAIARPNREDASDARAGTAAEATARQARLVAHEIRNTLVPVKTAGLMRLGRAGFEEGPSGRGVACVRV